MNPSGFAGPGPRAVAAGCSTAETPGAGGSPRSLAVFRRGGGAGSSFTAAVPAVPASAAPSAVAHVYPGGAQSGAPGVGRRLGRGAVSAALPDDPGEGTLVTTGRRRDVRTSRWDLGGDGSVASQETEHPPMSADKKSVTHTGDVDRGISRDSDGSPPAGRTPGNRASHPEDARGSAW